MYKSLLKNSHFLALWSSQFLSQLSIHIMNFTLVGRIFERTGSTIAVSILWICYALPAILLLPLAGPFVDIHSRKSILFFTNLLQGATMLLFLSVGNKIYPVFPLVFLYASLNQFYIPAEAASIPDLVEKNALAKANSLFLLTTQITFLLGFGIGGPILHKLGLPLTFTVSALMLLVAAVAITFLPEKAQPKEKLKSSFMEFWHEFSLGYKYILAERGVLFPLLVLTSGYALLSIMGAIFPLIGRDILGTSFQAAGATIFVPVGLGAMAGGLVVAKVLEKFRKRTVVEFGFASIAIILTVFSFVIPQITHADWLRISLGFMAIFLLGLASVFVFIPSQTIVQEKTPDILRGRILSVLFFFTSLASVIPLIFGAALAELMGIKTVLLIIAGASATALYYSRSVGANYLNNSNSHGK